MNNYTDNEIFSRVRKILGSILQINEEEINLEDSLFDDLGFESADLLDLNFRIENEFQIKIGGGDLWNLSENMNDDEEIIVDGKLTERGIDMAKKMFPFVEFADFKSDTELHDIFSLFTPKLICDFIQHKKN